MVYLIFFGGDVLIYQIMSAIGMSLFVMVIPNFIDAIKNPGSLRLFNFNEMVFLQVVYYFVIFNQVSPESNFKLGYAPIAIISLFVGSMLIYIVI